MPKYYLIIITFLFLEPLQSQTIQESFQKHINFLASDSIQGRGIGTKKMDLVRNYIERNFRSAGLKPLKYDYVLPFSGYSYPIRFDGYNIAGMLEGSDDSLKNEIIVLGAHYDHLGMNSNIIFNGANDNASGVALLLELAKELSSMRNAVKRSILFIAFDAEEAGLVGSFDFIKEDSVLLPKIQMMFSLDMVGTYNQSKKLIMTGFNLLKLDKDFYKDIATINDIKISSDAKYESRSDTYPFLRSGITSVHMTTGDDKNYHTPRDVPENIDYDGMEKIYNFSTDLLLKLNAEDKSVFSKVSDSNMVKLLPNFRYGYTLGFGSSYFNYSDKFYLAKSEIVAKAGISVDLFLYKWFSLNSGLFYSLTGSRHQYGTYRAHSIEIPLNLIFTTSDRTVFAKPFLIGGGYFSKHFYQTISDDKQNVKDIFRNFDTGLNFGFGLDIYNFQLTFISKMGLYDQHLDAIKDRILMNSFSVNFTYFK